MGFLRIVLLAVAASVVYGVVHDQVTARICIEYFTIGHPPLFGAITSPTLLGLGWGVFATWWLGAILGIGLALAARGGKRPKSTARSLVRPIGILIGFMGALAIVAAGAGHLAAVQGWVTLYPPMAERVPDDRHVAFITALWAHSASYLVGAVGGIALAIRTWDARRPPEDTSVVIRRATPD